MSGVVIATLLIVLHYLFPQVGVERLILLGVILGLFPSIIVTLYFSGRHSTKLKMVNKGYKIKRGCDQKKIFGKDTYHILRVDPGFLQFIYTEFNMNPFSVSKRTLNKIENHQRESATCEKCSTDLFSSTTPFSRDDGAYFIEKRKRLWFLGVPIREKVIGWESYCPSHKPSLDSIRKKYS